MRYDFHCVSYLVFASCLHAHVVVVPLITTWSTLFQEQITCSPMELDRKFQLGPACCATHYSSADPNGHGLQSLYCKIQPCNSDAIIQNNRNCLKSKFHIWNTNERVVFHCTGHCKKKTPAFCTLYLAWPSPCLVEMLWCSFTSSHA